MAISVTHRTTGGSTTNGSTYTTASITMTIDTLILCWVANEEGGTLTDPDTVASTSVSFTKILGGIDDGATSGRISLWGAIPTSTVTETVTATFTTGGSQANCSWSLTEVDGADVSTTVANAIVQSASVTSGSQGTSGSITLAAFGDTDNRPFAGFYTSQANTSLVAGTDFSLLGTSNPGETNSIGSEWRSDAVDTGPDMSWTGTSHYAGIAVEVKIAASALTPVTDLAGTLGTNPHADVDLTWTDPAGGETEMIIYGKDVTAGETEFTELQVLGGNAVSTTVTGLEPGHEYDISITASDGTNESDPDEITVTTLIIRDTREVGTDRGTERGIS